MKLIRGLQNLKSHFGSVVTIGNFDGVHIGHQKIIKTLVKKAQIMNLPSVLISFSPTPQHFFGHMQATLSSFKQKHALLTNLGLEEYLLINFNTPFSQLSADAFIQQILLKKLNIKHCIVGDDFRFGANRTGDFSLLQTFDFEVEKTPTVLHNFHRVSSSKIRQSLKKGDFNLANQLLGREFSISGKIIHGQKQGRAIDFPTINILIKRKISPLLGVFAVNVELNGKIYNGVCNLGKRPTIGGEIILLEAFLFDFNSQIYGENAKTVFKYKIRDEQKFDSFSALKRQIKSDVKDAKNFFGL
ncbi:FMN adenylyltransferase / riboflavin kinase [Candidatus Ruthia magnifica str. Cm (Calyptogena magnifica)]|uniref:Riboflavin biosynthesis protein n=1 Tax=Ruthia magnifica subsp. Calyptogena magnifica TaxID=413404 RepID=A1AV63_RUTMC|nr:bifunctional riboflavin kinase/FAD synthetase [Candidatus Ruthturnera calyptogenae]ABL01820.1 FMN adenylyltransferase / riboflavin kinase [Candidatus Ruthia magnifica str. Cm (Calyptogena magnifica)]